MTLAFPDTIYTADPSFTTLFRLLDDFDTYSREVQADDNNDNRPRRPQQQQNRHGRYRHGYSPRFDIRETDDAYELYGEVPGFDRKDIHIEQISTNDLLIKGHAQRPSEGDEQNKSGEGGGGNKDKVDGDKDSSDKDKKGGGSKTVRYLQKERQMPGNFAREFAFPGPLDELGIKANLENGILKIVAPKSKPSGGRRIEVS